VISGHDPNALRLGSDALRLDPNARRLDPGLIPMP